MNREFRRYGVTILESVPRYPSGTYEIDVVHFAESVLADAEREAWKICRNYEDRTGHHHRAVIVELCERCRASGIEPGKKRKPCSACGGKRNLGEASHAASV